MSYEFSTVHGSGRRRRAERGGWAASAGIRVAVPLCNRDGFSFAQLPVCYRVRTAFLIRAVKAFTLRSIVPPNTLVASLNSGITLSPSISKMPSAYSS